jgi:phage shock protein E
MKTGLATAIILFFMSLFSLPVFAEAVWVDVRSGIEHQMDSIDGDVHIPSGEISTKFPDLYPDKETEVNLYCRSGGRAGKALTVLQKAGYKNVRNAGGIEDARKERGLNSSK